MQRNFPNANDTVWWEVNILDVLRAPSLQANPVHYDMGMLSEKAIDNFIAIYERKFKEPITREDAVVIARRLVNLYRLFLRPLPPAARKETEEGPGPSVQAL